MQKTHPGLEKNYTRVFFFAKKKNPDVSTTGSVLKQVISVGEKKPVIFRVILKSVARRRRKTLTATIVTLPAATNWFHSHRTR
jgi:hypothetical protein